MKPIAEQTESSREMYRFAKHIQWGNRDKVEFTIPSKSDSRVRVFVKWKKFKAKLRMWRLGIKKLPALVLDGRIIFQGKLNPNYNIELPN